MLHYIKFKAKNAETLQTLSKHYYNLETMETTPRINVTLVLFWRFAGNLINSLQLVNWSIFVLRRRETTMVSMTLLYMGWQFEHPAFYAMLNC